MGDRCRGRDGDHEPRAVDVYLNWAPAVALGLALRSCYVRPAALPAALPILLLWACSKRVAQWLDRTPPCRDTQLLVERYVFCGGPSPYLAIFFRIQHRGASLANSHNVQEEGLRVAPRISPTNLGFLLNVRQVACDFGYLTVPEFVRLNLRTLATASQMEKYQGHFLNWYDTRSLAPLTPAIVSSVDNGNLVASLWTLQEGCLQLLDRPLLPKMCTEGLIDHLYVLATLGALPRHSCSSIEKSLRGPNWLQYLVSLPMLYSQIWFPTSRTRKIRRKCNGTGIKPRSASRRSAALLNYLLPCTLPNSLRLKDDPEIRLQNRPDDLPGLERMPAFIDSLTVRLQAAAESPALREKSARYRHLLVLLPEARARGRL